MQISIEKDKCMGCGMCEQKCGHIFKMGEDGKPEVIKTDCCGTTCCDCDVNEIAKECPGEAIKVE